jgi:hypothetical protein
VRLDQLDAVTERVVNMAPVASLDGLIGRDFIACPHCFGDHLGEVIDDKGWMGFSRWNEIFFDTQMDLQSSILKPAPAARDELWWFYLFIKAKDALIKGSCLVFAPRGHRNQNVINTTNGQSGTSYGDYELIE